MIDKALYRQALAWYRDWSEAEILARAAEARRLSSAEAWRRLVDLVRFCSRFSPEPNDLLRQEEIEALERYYEGARQVEARRQTHGNPDIDH